VSRSLLTEPHVGPAQRAPRGARRALGGLGALGGLAVLAALALLGTPSAFADGTWRLEQPAPPAGAPFKVPLGAPGDLSFFAPNRGLLAVEGNATIPRGLLAWDGTGWRQLSTVCGGPADTTRIAWAAANEFWTVTEPSQPRSGAGLGLCHVLDGKVVGSYSTAPQSPDPFRSLNAAACNGPSDCWFAGVGGQDPSGRRVGAFHLHWDGASLTSVYAPQGRGVTDLTFFGGKFLETTLVGVQPADRTTPVSLSKAEDQPFLVHKIVGRTFSNEPFVPVWADGVPRDGTELLAADSTGSDVWFAGGGAASGPSAPEAGGPVARAPIAVHYRDPFYQDVPIPDGTFPTNARFGDVAAIPGTTDAWVTVVPYAERASKTAKAMVARIGADGTVKEIDTLPSSGAGRGTAARIACAAQNDCWMVTRAGWMFHYTDGSAPGPLGDPLFSSLITVRPNESAAQFVPDTPPVDDSNLNAPPDTPDIVVEPPPTETIKALLKNVKVKLRVRSKGRDLALVVTFANRRARKIQLVASHKKRVVAKSKYVKYKVGKHTIVLKVTRKKYPDGLKWKTSEDALAGGDDDGSVTTTTDPATGTSTTAVRIPRSAR